MSSFLSRAAAIVVCSFALAATYPAQASVLYQFAPTSMSTPPGAPYTVFSVVGSLELSDAAFAAGSFDLDDIVSFFFQVNNGHIFNLQPTPPQPGQPVDPVPPQATGLISPTGELTDGHIIHFTIFDQLEIIGDAAGLWAGFFLTEGSAMGTCNETVFPCEFAGTWEIVAAPVSEPASLALLGAGLLALTLMGRRYRLRG